MGHKIIRGSDTGQNCIALISVPLLLMGQVPTAHQEADLVGRCSEASSDLEERNGEIEVLAPLQAGKHGRRVEGLAFQSIQDVHSGHCDAPSVRRG